MVLRNLRALAVVLLVGCDYTPPSRSGVIDAPSIDGSDMPLPDAAVCTAVSAECANQSTLRTCAGPGAMAMDTSCVWGCISGPARCGEVMPAGGAVETTDLDPTGLLNITLTDVTVNGDNGSITGNPAGFAYEQRGNVGVFRFRGLRLAGSVTLEGTRAIAFVADGAITVAGIVDATGTCPVAADTGETNQVPGPGGFIGGRSADATGAGPGAGDGSSSSTGGSGAGHGGTGGDGETTTGGIVAGDATITMLQGGSGGGAGGGGGNFGRGGAGGGGVQLVSNMGIVVEAAGVLDAGGCGGGRGGGNGDSGGGGGAGGTLLLEAPTVDIMGTLVVNGGAGGGGGGSGATAGPKGTRDRNPAQGGTGDSATEVGGNGAAASMINGAPGSTGTNPGGGGGAIGRIRINTRTGTVTVTGVMSPRLDDAPTTATSGAAPVQ